MSSATNSDQYPNAPWHNPAWGGAGQNTPNGSAPYWYGPTFWHPYGMSRPLGIAAMVLGFIFWWPIGLALLAFMIASGRIGCHGRRAWAQQNQQGGTGWQASPPWSGWSNWCGGGNGGNRKPASSGNHAFDDYRTETLRRLEDEQKDFTAFLDRLRFAKDKAEFDQFMSERRQAPRPPSAPSMGPDDASHG